MTLITAPRLVRQINEATCVQACLAMVTGEPIEAVIAELGAEDGPIDDWEEIDFLTRRGIYPHRSAFSRLSFRGVYLISAPSLNQLGRLHRLVAFNAGKGFKLIDPNTGREGKHTYRRDAVAKGKCSYTEATYLRDCTK